jgi:NAD(P)-dependent dehydrogenase (short-subunit alcohol dehydrogenase family)
LRTNLDSVFFFSRECFPYLAAHADHKGAIVNVSSAMYKIGAGGGAPYTASKHAIIGLTKNTAKHNKGKVTCNAVAPGCEWPRDIFECCDKDELLCIVVATNIWDSVPEGGIDKEDWAVCEPIVAMAGEPLKAEDVARAILFMATNPMVNGAVLEVDGGLTA